MKSFLTEQNRPYKILWFGDLVTPSGFGRIGNEVGKRLALRGYVMQGAAISYTGWPHALPFNWIYPLGGQDIFGGLTQIANGFQPDLIVSCQDFPYHLQIWNACRIDFSRIKWMFITPIDGTPIHSDWVKLVDFADGAMVISRFGVEAMRQEGKRISLCHPGVDASEFYPAESEERTKLRALMGYGADDYIVGVVCMNQGRKAISKMVEGFFEFARDKPDARLYLDMDKTSPAGWDIPTLLTQMNLSDGDKARVKYREDAFKAQELLPLRNRYVMLDVHMVISHREGFGLPILESMACKIPSMALDYCSGPEIAGEGRGVLVKRIDYMESGTWGGARDAFPDMADLIRNLNQLYADKSIAALFAQRGYEWAVKQTWDAATDQVEGVIQSALARPRKDKPIHAAPIPNPAPGLSDVYGPSHHPKSESINADSQRPPAAQAVGDNSELQ